MSPNKLDVIHEVVRRNPDINPHATAIRVEELMQQIEELKADRDFYIKECEMERAKNRELEEEFAVLRGLIAETRPVGYEENIVLKNQFLHEREMRVQAENDVNRLRMQLADTLAASHRDTMNLKKALTDMQQTNAKSLATIYEKGD